MLLQLPARSSDAISISPSWHMALDKAQYGSNAVGSPTPCASILPEPALDIDTVTISDGASVYSAQADEEEQVIEGVMIHDTILSTSNAMPAETGTIGAVSSYSIDDDQKILSRSASCIGWHYPVFAAPYHR